MAAPVLAANTAPGPHGNEGQWQEPSSSQDRRVMGEQRCSAQSAGRSGVRPCLVGLVGNASAGRARPQGPERPTEGVQV
ncbi:hypothetical protein PGT21_022799 [Puccinia graminis f. sp. tritici]|uniref:Uncharacterized protein n=1 Tax=Puccinia graminis f. sp. tritici TaxID=56615 RepID=A0A5B0MDT8_PUCGR|nr:hypothetical protein PGT21_022799 [Puccinia graminis f. sp. tritici]